MRGRVVCVAVAALALGAGSAVAVDPSPSGPEVVDVRVGVTTGSFQSKAIFFRTPRVGWPHRLNRRELRSVAVGVGVVHGRVFRERGLPRGRRVVCGYRRGLVRCVVRDGRGVNVAWYPVRRVFEDGSVVVWLPLAPSMSVVFG